MELYLELLPNELINQIALYLDYQGTIKLRVILEDKYTVLSDKPLINYELLLLSKFPGVHRAIKEVKQNSIHWKNYTYERGYNLMNLVELYLKNQIEADTFDTDTLELLYEDDFGELMGLIYDHGMDIGEIYALDKAYTQIIDKSVSSQFIKYRVMMPEITNIDEYFFAAYNRYYDDVIKKGIVPLDYVRDTSFNLMSKFYDFNIVDLIIYYLVILDNPTTINYFKDNKLKEISIGNNTYNSDRQYIEYMIIFQHMKEYINNKNN